MRIFSVSLLLKSAGYGNCGGRKLPRGIVVRTAQVQALTRESWSTTLLPYLGTFEGSTKVLSKVQYSYYCIMAMIAAVSHASTTRICTTLVPS